MKKTFIGLSTFVALGLSTASFGWSFQSDSFCNQYSDPKTTLAELTSKGIKEVDQKAQYTVAQMYEHGCGADKNLPQAYAWYQACSNTNPDAQKQKTVLYNAFNKDDKQRALGDALALTNQITPYAHDLESKKYLEDTHSDYASQHPAAVIQQFNQSYQAVQDE